MRIWFEIASIRLTRKGKSSGMFASAQAWPAVLRSMLILAAFAFRPGPSAPNARLNGLHLYADRVGHHADVNHVYDFAELIAVTLVFPVGGVGLLGELEEWDGEEDLIVDPLSGRDRS